MINLQSAFQELLVSPAKLAQCARVASVQELFSLLKHWWRREHLNDENLLAELNVCNRRPLDLDPYTLASHWLPYRYHANSRTISWCLPQGRPVTPFFDQFIEDCHRLTVNQILKPKTVLEHAPGKTNNPASPPTGFIFHVSRCGSTLVSGAFAELEHSHVLSESPLLTESLLDPGLTDNVRRPLLQSLMDLQNRWIAESKAVIVKWNAWDLFHWPLIRALYPRVPVLLLVRDPVEILASHQHLTGRHMSGDPSLAGLAPVFQGMFPHENPLDFRIRVLHSLLEVMNGICEQAGVMVVNYAQLAPETIRAIGRHFGIAINSDDYSHIRQRMKFHSKELNRQFQPDSLQKRQQFGKHERNIIHRELNPLYRRLLTFTSPQLEGAVAC